MLHPELLKLISYFKDIDGGGITNGDILTTKIIKQMIDNRMT